MLTRGTQDPSADPAAKATITGTDGVALTELPLNAEAAILAVCAPDGAVLNDLAASLAELGLLPGERVRVLARASFGGPLAVRVGSGTFALRRAEAAWVRVAPVTGLAR